VSGLDTSAAVALTSQTEVWFKLGKFSFLQQATNITDPVRSKEE
jgi:hypothetical protein